MIYKWILILLFLFPQAWGQPNESLDKLYREGQRVFRKHQYKKALPLLEKYIRDSKGKKYKRDRLFWVIDQVGRIHLRVNRDPVGATKFFTEMLKDKRLNEAEEDDIEAWLTASRDWKNFGNMPRQFKSESELFKTGKKFFDKGKKIQKFPLDDAGNAYFSIAKTYLVPISINYDRSKNIAEVLYMLGEIQRLLRTDKEYWTDNYYFKEVIRRFPKSQMAKKAWNKLNEDIRWGYTGSGGDSTPKSVDLMLKKYRSLAY